MTYIVLTCWMTLFEDMKFKIPYMHTCTLYTKVSKSVEECSISFRQSQLDQS